MALDKIKTDIIADDAITSAKVADDAVGNSQIADTTGIKSDRFSVPSTDTTGRDALSGVAAGDLIYNSTIGVLQQRTSDSTWSSIAAGPAISSVTYPNGSDGSAKTALDAGTNGSGGTETLLINGSNFSDPILSIKIKVSGSDVNLGASFTRNSSTLITVNNTVLRVAGTYTITVTNKTGLSSEIEVIFSGTPGFDTAANLGSVLSGLTLNKTITTTTGGDGTITFTQGSPNTPDWMTATGGVSGTLSTGSTRTFSLVGHATGGAGTMTLAGTTANTGTAETFTFGIIVKDAQNQGEERDYTLTVTSSPTGGTITTYSGYKVHSWTTVGTNQDSGAFVIYAATTVDILIVAGGGGAGSRFHAGGGGAGGVRQLASQALTTGTYNIIVGDGGAGGVGGGANVAGTKGSNSSVIKTDSSISLAATGGGGGAAYNTNGGAGGSGGGGNGGETAGSDAVGVGNQGSYSPVEGYNGVGYNIGSAGYHAGGGGGGAGSVGGNSGKVSDGGDGVGNAYRSGSTVHYGGGGVGSNGYDSSGQSGTPAAVHGGGVLNTVGTANTGGGGGATSSSSAAGSKGGSGIIVIRYAV